MKKITTTYTVYEADMILGKGIAIATFANEKLANEYVEMKTAKNEDPMKEYFVK